MQAHELCERLKAWGAFRVIRRIETGYRNHVFEVVRNGQRFAAKTTERTEAQLAWVAGAMSLAESVGLVTPRFLRLPHGAISADCVTVETWIDGVSAETHDLPKVATLLQQFHQNSRHHPQRPGFASSQALLAQTAGGDVDLASMPANLVEACRAAWQGLHNETRTIVHGDPNASNILRTPDGRYALIDWDEARVDASIFDLVGLLESDGAISAERWQHAKHALNAWEVAVSWQREPAYARRLAQQFIHSASSLAYRS